MLRVSKILLQPRHLISLLFFFLFHNMSIDFPNLFVLNQLSAVQTSHLANVSLCPFPYLFSFAPHFLVDGS